MEILFEEVDWGFHIGLLMLLGFISVISATLCIGYFKSFLKKRWTHIIPACAWFFMFWLFGRLLIHSIVLGVYSEYTAIVTDKDAVIKQGYSILEENGQYMKLGKFKNE